jgi:hypothetical protein
MDLASLIVTLILLAMFAGALYFGYQKLVVDDVFELTKEPVEITTTPIEYSPPPPGEVSGVDSKRGRPALTAAHKYNDPACDWRDVNGCKNRIPWYANTEQIVPAGQAETADVCRDFSRSMGINHWGWDRKKKSCFAYVDSSFLNAMSIRDGIEGISDYSVGCTEPGLKVLDGCRDMTKGDVVWGLKYPAERFKYNYASVPYHQSWGGIKSFEACRKEANNKGYDMFTFRGSRDTSRAFGYCAYVRKPEDHKGFTGDYGGKAYMTACTDPSKKVVNACQ